MLFGGAGVFHGALALGVVGLIAFALFGFLRRRRRSLYVSLSLLSRSAVLMLASIIFIIGSSALGVSLNKIGELQEMLSGDTVSEAVVYRIETRVSSGGSSYPDALRGLDPFSNPHVIPGRILYFLFSPFPWDIHSASHMLGFFATFMFLYMFFSIAKSTTRILADPRLLLIAIIMVIVIISFGISIDNIGTSIRHRTKFFYPLLVLCMARVLSRYRIVWRAR